MLNSADAMIFILLRSIFHFRLEQLFCGPVPGSRFVLIPSQEEAKVSQMLASQKAEKPISNNFYI